MRADERLPPLQRRRDAGPHSLDFDAAVAPQGADGEAMKMPVGPGRYGKPAFFQQGYCREVILPVRGPGLLEGKPKPAGKDLPAYRRSASPV